MNLPKIYTGTKPYTTHVGVYCPDGIIIALFFGPNAEQNAKEFLAEKCSHFCTRVDYTCIGDVLVVLP